MAGKDDPTASWAASLESPFDRLDRDLQDLRSGIGQPNDAFNSRLGRNDSEASVAPLAFAPSDPSTSYTSEVSVVDKGKSKADQSQTVFRHGILSPLKVRDKAPKRIHNPYVPPNMRPKDWDGIVDLANTPLRSGCRHHPSHLRKADAGGWGTPRRHGESRTGKDEEWNSGEEAEEDAKFFARMSPPVTMDFARPRASAINMPDSIDDSIGSSANTGSDSDSEASFNRERASGQPSAASFLASQRQPHDDDEDSFGSSNHSSDSLDSNAMGAGGGEAIPPSYILSPGS